MLELVRKIVELMGAKVEPDIRNEAHHEIPHQSLNAAKARTMLGWCPRFTLDEGLRATISWYVAFLKEKDEWRRKPGAGFASRRR